MHQHTASFLDLRPDATEGDGWPKPVSLDVRTQVAVVRALVDEIKRTPTLSWLASSLYEQLTEEVAVLRTKRRRRTADAAGHEV
jgi:hypothetical protein